MKTKLRPSWEIHDRILWDEKINQQAFFIGYHDRVAQSGCREKPLIEWAGGDIPWNRVLYIRCGDSRVWDRELRLDLFESNKLPVEAFNEISNNSGQGITVQSSAFFPKSIYQQKDGKWDFFAGGGKSIEVKKISILSFNILSDGFDQQHPVVRSDLRMPALIKLIRDSGADIIVLQEVTTNWLKKILAEPWTNDWFLSRKTSSPILRHHGIVVLSRYPYSLVEYNFSQYKIFPIVSFNFKDNPLHLACVHLSSNRGANAPEVRALQVQNIITHLKSLFGTLGIVGDFNMRGEEGLELFKKEQFDDLWTSLRPKEEGLTFDIAQNPLAAHFSLSGKSARFDRFLIHQSGKSDWKAKDIIQIGTQPIEGISDKLYPSDHFGILTRLEALANKKNKAKENHLQEIQPSYQTALVIIPPKETWPQIQAIRKQFDSKIQRWMPHINLLYGFLPASFFEIALEGIASTLKSLEAFSVSLKNYGFFEHRSTCGAWLSPQADRKNALEELQTDLEKIFPQCKEQSDRLSGYQPHLSIGQFASKQEALSKLPHWHKLLFSVEYISLISREKDSPFQEQYRIYLGSGKIEPIGLSRKLQYAVHQHRPPINSVQRNSRNFAKEMLSQACSDVLGHEVLLYALGSERLGTASADSDIDLLCLIPTGLEKWDFLQAVQEQLEGLCEQSNLAAEAKVPALRLKIEGISIDLLCAQNPNFPAAIHTIKEANQHQFDETSWFAIAGYLEVDNILNRVESVVPLELFLELVRTLRIWTAQRGIVGNAWGFPGNYSWTVLAAWACLNYPKDQPKDLPALVRHFFDLVQQHDWSIPLSIMPEGKDYKIREKQDRLPIITTIAPYFNSARNVTISTFEIVQKEIKRAAAIIAKLEKLKNGWEKLFSPTSKTDKTRCTLIFEATKGEDLQLMEGWAQGHIVGLIIGLEMLGSSLRPHPRFEHPTKLKAEIILELLDNESHPGISQVVEGFQKEFDRWSQRPVNSSLLITFSKKNISY